MVKDIKNFLELIILFLVPGIFVALGYMVIVSPLLNFNLPGIVAIGISSIFIMIPIELGIIAYYSRKELGSYSIKKMIVYNEKLSMKKYLLLTFLVLIFALIVMGGGTGIDVFIKDKLFFWLPKWYELSVDYSGLTKIQLLITFLFAFLITGIIIPITEEIYFRGFLLPRMKRFGKLAPLTNVFLFSLYHFWTPWKFLTRTIALIPFSYATYKTKDIRIPILVHCLLNIIGDSAIILILLLN